MLNFMPKDEPEVVYSIKADRHRDYRRAINPECSAVNLGIGQKLDDHKSNACIRKDFRNLTNFLRSNENLLELRKSRAKL
jgi:hypothetical protein